MKIAIIGRTEILYDTAVMLLQQGHIISLIVTSKAAPEYTRTERDFEELAKTCGAKFIKTAKINSIKNEMQGVADISVSINYSGIIAQDIIDCFPLGILNAHGGDLPRYRGNACQAWAIINGEDRIGLCIHRMVGGELDSGDIVARDYLPIDINTKVTVAWNWMCERIPSLIVQALSELQKDPAFVLEEQSKNPTDALRCFSRRPEDGKIDWSKDAVSIQRLINASNKPYRGAFCIYEGREITIWDSRIIDPGNILAVPGQIMAIEQGAIEVATGSGAIKVTSIEDNGFITSPDTLFKFVRDRLS